MKISQMTTDQMAACLCEIAEPVAEIVTDAETLAAMQAMQPKKGETYLVCLARGASGIARLLLKTHYEATIAIIAALTGKSAQAVRAQRGVQTIRDATEIIDQELIDFFQSSAATAADA